MHHTRQLVYHFVSGRDHKKKSSCNNRLFFKNPECLSFENVIIEW